MIGSKEYSIFIKSGVTPEKSKNYMNQRLDEIVNETNFENQTRKRK